MTTKPTEAQKLIEVTLVKAHTHAGKKLPVGSKIGVTQPEQQWLIQHGIVADPNAPAATKETVK